jgi:hypothetical protein
MHILYSSTIEISLERFMHRVRVNRSEVELRWTAARHVSAAASSRSPTVVSHGMRQAWSPVRSTVTIEASGLVAWENRAENQNRRSLSRSQSSVQKEVRSPSLTEMLKIAWYSGISFSGLV